MDNEELKQMTTANGLGGECARLELEASAKRVITLEREVMVEKGGLASLKVGDKRL